MDEAFGEEALAAIRGRPRFRDAVEQLARDRADHYRRLDPALRWTMTDLGRTALATGAVVLSREPEGLTAQRLIDLARAGGVCSRGRALAFLDGAQKRALLTISPGAEHWRRRHIILSEALQRLFEANARIVTAAAERLELESVDAGRERDADGIGLVVARHPDLLTALPPPIRKFLEHDGAMRVLDALIVRQPAGRVRLLDTAPFSRLSLARAAGVSRAQVSRLLATAVAEGLVEVRGNELEFTPEFSDAAERRYALIFRIAELSAEATSLRRREL